MSFADFLEAQPARPAVSMRRLCRGAIVVWDPAKGLDLLDQL
jgi:hypothetical protein